MIRPDRHTNPDHSVINISANILIQLNSFYDISYDELLQKVTRSLGAEAIENFPYALSFLFLLGKITYLEEKDSFIYNAVK